MSEEQQTSGPTKVFVGNLSYFTKNQDLQTIFQPHGEILETKVCISKDRGPLYYGFVQFQNGEQAKQAVAAVHGMKFLGRRLKVHCQNLQKNQKDQQDSADKGVQVLFSFVCTQPASLLLTEEIFELIFLSCGNVIDCIVKSHVCDTRKVIKNIDASAAVNDTQETSNHHTSENEYLRQGGYGFVTFSDWETAKRVIDIIHLVLLPKHLLQPLNKDDFQLLIKGSAEESSVLSNQGSSLNYHGKDMVVLDLDCKLSRTASSQLSDVLPATSESMDQQNNSSNKGTRSNNNNTNVRPSVSRLSSPMPSNVSSNHSNAYLHHYNQQELQHHPFHIIHPNNNSNVHNLNNANSSNNNVYNNTNLQQVNPCQSNMGSFQTFPPHVSSFMYSPVPNTDIPSTSINHVTVYPVSNPSTGNIQALSVSNNSNIPIPTSIVYASNNATNDNNNTNVSMPPNMSPSFPSPSSHMQPIYHCIPTHNLPHNTHNNYFYHYNAHQHIASFSPANSPPPRNMTTEHETYPFQVQPQLQLQQLHNVHLQTTPVYYPLTAAQQVLYPVYGLSSSATYSFQSQTSSNNSYMPNFPQNNCL